MKTVLIILSIAATTAVPCGLLYAQEQETDSKMPPSLGEEILRTLQFEKVFKELQQYIRLPLPGTGREDFEVNREKVSELNIQIGKETGVDLITFFQFIGKILIIVLEGTARIIRGIIQAI